MNELIKFKNRKLKHKYNKISNKDVKNELLISEIMYEMIDTIIINIEENECRICFEEETPDNPFVWPCRCKGTSKFVHASCLETWRNENIDRPPFELCMECRYTYKFLNEYPYEFKAIIPVNIAVIFFSSQIIPILLTFPISQINKSNNNSIINFYAKNHNAGFYNLMKMSRDYYDILNYDLCYNIIVFNQTLLLMLIHSTFTFINVYRKTEYFKYVKNTLPIYFLYMFKFIILLNIENTGYDWITTFLILTFFFPLIEPLFYLSVLKRHNKILHVMDLDNKYILQNYDSDNDEDISQHLSDVL